MTRLVTRVASFGRRRRPTSKDIDSSARTPSPCTSGGTSSFDEDSLNRSEVVYNTDELYGPLMKKHLRGSTFNEWGKRWASVDDAIGVLFMYKSGKEWERRAPSRLRAQPPAVLGPTPFRGSKDAPQWRATAL